MPKYSVVGAVSGSKYLGEFEAESAEQAIDLAMASGAATVCLCHHCISECEDPEVISATAELLGNNQEEGNG